MGISRFDTEVLHSEGLLTGLGFNGVGLDRGQMGESRIVKFQRVGPKIMMVQLNYNFCASTVNPDEVRTSKNAFAKSILWGFKVAAETEGRVLADLTDFLMRDTRWIQGRLKPEKYKLDKSRSAVYMPMTHDFPKNTEMEVTLTFVLNGFPPRRLSRGDTGFQGVGDVAASATVATFRVYQSLVELPDDNYKP